jgi:hypothetical protein
MLKKMVPIILFNVIVSAVFVFSSVNFWGILNSSFSSFSPNEVGITQVSITLPNYNIPYVPV